MNGDRFSSSLRSLEVLEVRVRKGIGGIDALAALFGDKRLWWLCCQEACESDRAWLFSDVPQAWLLQIEDWDRIDPSAGVPLVVVARMMLNTARALAGDGADAERAAVELSDFWASEGVDAPRTRYGGLASPGSTASVPPRLRRAVERTLDYLATVRSQPAAALAAVTLLLLAGAQPQRRPRIALPVVFGGGAGGPAVAGRLVVEKLSAGPPGLFPDPRSMAALRGLDRFWKALHTAWRLAGAPTGTCVLWRVELDSGDLRPSIDGGSLGAAFALALRELVRPSPVRRLLRTVRRGTAVTGRVDESGALKRIGNFDAKYRAALGKHWALIVPEENRDEHVNVKTRREPRFAATIDEASKLLHGWRTRTIAAAVSVMITVGAGVGLVLYQNAAMQRQRTADALAQTAQDLVAKRIDLAQLFASAAYRTAPTAQARQALFQTITASPHFVRAYAVPAAVTAIASSGDGRTAVVGTEDGNVVAIHLADGGRSILTRLPAKVLAVATNTDGSVVSATSDHSAITWTSAHGPRAVPIPIGWTSSAVAVSPSGSTVLVVAQGDHYNGDQTLTRIVTRTGESTTLQVNGFFNYVDYIALPNDQDVVAFDGDYGDWQRLRLADLAVEGSSHPGFGQHNEGATLSANGRFISYTNGSKQFPVWPTVGHTDVQSPPLVAATGDGEPKALAISNDGKRVARASDNRTIYMSETVSGRPHDPWYSPGNQYPAPTALTGAGVAAELTFVGDSDTRLLSSTADLLSLWDLNQQSRIASSTSLPIPESCNGCRGPRLAVNATGEYVAIVDGENRQITVQKTSPPFPRELTFEDGRDPAVFGPPSWTHDGEHVVTVHAGDDAADVRTLATGLPIVDTWSAELTSPASADPVVLLAIASDGRSAIQVRSSQAVELRNPIGGQLSRKILIEGGAAFDQPSVAVDDRIQFMAMLASNERDVLLTDLATQTTTTLPVANASAVAFAGPRLIVQRLTGQIEIYDPANRSTLRFINGIQGRVSAIATNGVDLLAELNTTAATLIDLTTGETIGALPLPPQLKANSAAAVFAPESRRLLTATEGIDTGLLIAWSLDIGSWLGVACDSSGHDLTTMQWTQYSQLHIPSDLRCKG